MLIRTIRPIVLTLLLVGLFTTSAALAIDGTPVWFPSTVATLSPDNDVASPSLAFNHLGMPSVSWAARSNVGGVSTVFRSERSGLGLWAHRTVVAGVGVGVSTSLSFDRAERPIVAWMTDAFDIHADFNNGDVVGFVSANANSQSAALSISHDLAGNLRGVFGGSTTGSLRSVDFNGSSFSSLSLATIPSVDQIVDAQLATDHAGLRHIVARAEMAGGLEGVMIASEPTFAGAWSTATLDAATSVGGVSLATNPVNGRVGIAYTTRSAGVSRLKYAEFNGVTLETTELMQSSASVYEDLSLAYDLSDGRPAIAFEEDVFSGPEQLKLAYMNGLGTWEQSLIDDSIMIDSPTGTGRPSLAFDDYGTSYPAVAYVDADGSLVVAFDPPAVPEPASILPIVLAIAVGFRRKRRSPHDANRA